MTAFITWWMATTLLGWLAFPLSYFTLRFLPDRGYAASRVIALVVPCYVAWLLQHWLTGWAPLLAGLAVLAALSFVFGQGHWRGHLAFLRAHLAHVVIVEILFVVALVLYMAFETSIGSIFQTEKPADFTILHGVMASPHMPPHDPWFSGTKISYYYFGYYMIGFVGKLTGTAPALTHNMGACLIFALTSIMAYSIGWALTARRRYGLLLVFALTAMGNLDYWYRLPQVFRLGNLQEKYVQNVRDNPAIKNGVAGAVEYLVNPISHGWEYFQAARIVAMAPGEHLITEFPAFSFVLADLHPHMISLPFFLLTLALAFNLLRAPLSGWRTFGWRRPWQVLQGLVVALLYGSLGFINSWDLPTVLLVLGLCLALREIWTQETWSWRWLLATAAVGLPLLLVAIGAYVPFYLSLTTQAKGVGLVGHRTDLYDWPFLIGPFLLTIVPALFARARAGRPGATPEAAPAAGAAVEKRKDNRKKKTVPVARRAAASAGPAGPHCVLCGRPAVSGEARVCPGCGGEIVGPPLRAEWPQGSLKSLLSKLALRLSGAEQPWARILPFAVAAIAIFDLALSDWNPAVTVFSLLLAALAVASLAVRSESRELAFSAVLVALAFVLMAGCEWLYVHDLFATLTLYRMNTMFKFYMQAWVLLAVGGIALFAWFRENAWPSWSLTARRLWNGAAAFVLVGAVAFPIVGVKHHVDFFGSPVSMLDGSEFLHTLLPDDARAIAWLRENVHFDGDKAPVLLEAWGTSFSLYGRMATFTGFSTIMGWEGHEEQWRGGKQNRILGGIDAQDNVERRYLDSNTLYESPSLDETRSLLRRYGIQYVVVGRLERERHPDADFGKWEKLGRVVFSQGTTTIYSLVD